MPDKITPEQRSYIMSRIRSKWTKQEVKVHNWLKGNKIKHKMHPKIDGSPDLILKDRKIAVFIHGCFWHRCPKCYVEPKSNTEFWKSKIKRNTIRDRKNNKILKDDGWSVLVLWEHSLNREFDNCMGKIRMMS